MTNQEIAEIFERIADLLELQGENPFKARSYRRSAEVIRSLPEEVANIQARGELLSLPGVGASLAQKIEELLTTGSLQYYEDLRAAVPPGLVEMLAIPDLGPRTAARLYEELGIATIEELEQAAREHRIRVLKGFGAKSEENLLRGIELYRRGQERIPYGVALPQAQTLVAALEPLPQVQRISVAGSLRRYRETIKDLDLLVASEDPQPVIDTFVGLPAVAEVIAAGTTKASIRLETDLQADLRVVAPECFGAALQYFTGSQAHNIALRGLAQELGLKVNEYGVFRGEERLAGETEEEVYAALGLPYIPPPLREDRGEIQAALKGRLPGLITRADLRGDLHVHTNWSDGALSLEGMAQAARARGYEYLLISDHSKSLTVANGLDEGRLLRQGEEIAALNEQFDNFRLLWGVEVDIFSEGRLDLDPAVLAQLDIVVAAVHTGFKQSREQITRRLIAAMESGVVDIIAHPTGRLLGRREAYELDFEALLAAAARTGVALELNAAPERLDLGDIHLRAAKEHGVPIVIGTDAHHPDQLDFIHFGLGTAQRGWLEPSDVLNTLPVEELLAHFRRRKGK
ncbi:MAG TPA: DNA polymerase/3'-5' exonuclease PolX, partial [Armatimonadetes bacterium]|nr:DNA polymerase/3'-5' exonuclease PolX [Armatimonadota bacterium]